MFEGGPDGDPALSIRRRFVLSLPDHVFIDCDYRQIELVAFAQAVSVRFGLDSAPARLVNGGADLHRLIAASVLDKDPAAVTKPERDGARPISFGRPCGMGPSTLQAIPRAGYGFELEPAEVQARIDAYERLCPELQSFLKDEVDAAMNLAHELALVPEASYAATRQARHSLGPDDRQPQGWLGGCC